MHTWLGFNKYSPKISGFYISMGNQHLVTWEILDDVQEASDDLPI